MVWQARAWAAQAARAVLHHGVGVGQDFLQIFRTGGGEAFLNPQERGVLAEMQDTKAKPPALDQQTMADASNMSADDQQATIAGSVFERGKFHGAIL